MNTEKERQEILELSRAKLIESIIRIKNYCYLMEMVQDDYFSNDELKKMYERISNNNLK